MASTTKLVGVVLTEGVAWYMDPPRITEQVERALEGQVEELAVQGQGIGRAIMLGMLAVLAAVVK